MSKKIFDRLSPKPKLTRVIKSLRAVNSEPINVLGRTTLRFTMNGLTMSQNFYVVETLNKNFILGRDWLKENGVRLYFDLGMLRVGQTYVKLEEDTHICSILRLSKRTTIKPQTAVICHVKLQRGFHLSNSRLIEISQLEPGCISNEPGITLKESVNTVKSPYRIPVLIINETNKSYRLRRGSVIGKARPLNSQDILAIDEDEPMEIDDPRPETDIEDLYVPDERRGEVIRLLRNNRDLIAKSDSDLGGTRTVQMKISTGNHPPIKNRPYRTPLNKRKIIDQAIDEMLEAKVIQRSQSPWSFPLEVAKKKD